MIQKEIGPHEFWRSGTARDPSRDRHESVNCDDSELAIATLRDVRPRYEEIATAGPLDSTESQGPDILYDSGWTKQGTFNLRVRWYGVPDDGSRQRWVSDVLSHHTNKTAQG